MRNRYLKSSVFVSCVLNLHLMKCRHCSHLVNNGYLRGRNLYGSSRLGQEQVNMQMGVAGYQYAGVLAHEVGDKRYELSNHLGNVLQVVRDAKLPIIVNDILLDESFTNTANINEWTGTPFYDNNQTHVPSSSYSASIESGILLMKSDGQTMLDNVMREVPLIQGQQYKLSFNLTDMGNGSWMYVSVGPDIYDNGTSVDPTWISSAGNYTYTFTADSWGAPYYIIFMAGDCDEIHLDNIRLEKIGGAVAYLADVESFSDYYPYGMQMPGMHGTESSDGYRYGFQSQEVDNEVKGSGNSVNYTYRMHDPRVGRFFAVDPISAQYPWNSPYAFSENNVIDAIELEGLEKVEVYNQWYDKKGDFQKKYSHTYIDNALKENMYLYDNYNSKGKVNYKEYVGQESGRTYVAPVGQVDNYTLYSSFNGEDKTGSAYPVMATGEYRGPFKSVEMSIQGTLYMGSTSHTIGISFSDTGGDSGLSMKPKNETAIDYTNAEVGISGGIEFQGNFTNGDDSKVRTDAGLEVNKGIYSGGIQGSTNGQYSIKVGIQPKLTIPILQKAKGVKIQTVIDHTK